MTRTERYTTVAVALHWLIALLVLGMVPAGWWMSDAIKNPETQMQAFQVFQLHKSMGFTILALTVARLVWRLMHPAPPLPAGMAGWQRLGAHLTHWGFYALLILIPLSGWVYVSTGWSAELARPVPVPTLWFGLFEIPHLPFIAGQPQEARVAISEASMSAHSALVWGGIVLFVLHVGAALKHHVMDGDGVLARMIPFIAPPKEKI